VALFRKDSSTTASLRTAADETSFSQTALQGGAAVADIEPNLETDGSLPEVRPKVETRTYRGATYEKGDDGQWHLQRK